MDDAQILGVIVVGLFAASLISAWAYSMQPENSSEIIIELPPSDAPELPPSDTPEPESFLKLELNASSVSWGTLHPGEVAYQNVSVKNIGNVPGEISVRAQNWNPAGAPEFLVFSAFVDPVVLAPGESGVMVCSLNVSSLISGITDFNFEVVVSVVENF